MMHKDPNKRRAWRKAHYQANCEKAKAYSKAYRKANKERLSAYHKIYQQANKEKLKVQSKAWRKAHPEKMRERDRKKYIQKHTTQIESINDKIVYLRDGWICQICKKRVDKRFKYPNPMSASLDHIRPISKGGTHTYNNVQLAHLSCNVNKNVNILPQGEQIRLF